MSPAYVQVDMRSLPSHRSFHTITGREQIIWRGGEVKPRVVNGREDTGEAEVRVIAGLTNSHPLDGAVIYRIEYGGRRLIFATDVEWGGVDDLKFFGVVEGGDPAKQ